MPPFFGQLSAGRVPAATRLGPANEGFVTRLGRRVAHVAIRAYQLSLSALVGRYCRHVPSCSTYADEAIQRHGLWAGGWMGAARICRCHPWGTSGLDPVPDETDERARWYLPWRYGRWRTVAPENSLRR